MTERQSLRSVCLVGESVSAMRVCGEVGFGDASVFRKIAGGEKKRTVVVGFGREKHLAFYPLRKEDVKSFNINHPLCKRSTRKKRVWSVSSQPQLP